MKGKKLLVIWLLANIFVLYWFLQLGFQALNGSDFAIFAWFIGSAIILVYLVPWIIKTHKTIKPIINKIIK